MRTMRIERVTLADGPLAVRDEGEGVPVVALHGSVGDARQWAPLSAALGGGWRVLAPDLHGCGQSPAWPGLRPFRLGEEAAAVHALCREVGPVHLVGHGFGGALALRAALEAPAAVRSLTLIEPAAHHLLLREPDGAVRELVGEIEGLAHDVQQALLAGDARGAMARVVDYWDGPDSWGRLPASRQTALRGRAYRVALDLRAALKEPTSLAACRALAMPTLLIKGDGSPRPNQAICRLLVQTLPSAQLVVIKGEAHSGLLRAPDRWLPPVIRRLTEPPLARAA